MEELRLNWETGASAHKVVEDNCSSSLDLEYGRTSSHSQLTGLETRNTSIASLAEATPRVVNLAPQELLFYGENLAQVLRWKVLEKLGQGSYGIVRKAVNVDTGEVAALKIMNLSALKEVERMRIRREIDVQSRLKHSKVISILQVFEAPESQGSLIFILMELHDGQDLFRHLKHLNRSRLKERQAKELFVQMLSAVHYCHTSSVVHRDIKLENFLYNETSGEIKLCDFGLCNTWASSLSSSSLSKSPEGFFSTFVGSPVYMAPEIVKKKQNYSGPAVDVWALGVVLYSLLVGSQPFVSNGTLVVQRLLLGSCSYPRFLSKESKSLLQSMLNPDATRRITSSQILQHPWIHSTVLRSSNHFSYLPTLPSPQSSDSSLSSGSKRKKAKSSFFSCIS